jgi:HK97 family phage portal protein
LFNVSDIARFLNIPPAMLLDNNRNTADLNLQFLTQCLAPWIALIEDELNRKLITEDDLYFDMDEKSLLRTDLKSTAEYYDTLVSGGILTIKEVRDLLGFETLEGTDKLIIPYTDID